MRRARAHQSRAVLCAALLLLANCGESEKASERRRQADDAFGALQQPVIDAEAPLREFAEAANLEIGTAIGGYQFNDPEWRDIVAREFNQVTVNWGLYWGEVEPTRGEFDFSVVELSRKSAESEKSASTLYRYLSRRLTHGALRTKMSHTFGSLQLQRLEFRFS